MKDLDQTHWSYQAEEPDSRQAADLFVDFELLSELRAEHWQVRNCLLRPAQALPRRLRAATLFFAYGGRSALEVSSDSDTPSSPVRGARLRVFPAGSVVKANVSQPCRVLIVGLHANLLPMLPVPPNAVESLVRTRQVERFLEAVLSELETKRLGYETAIDSLLRLAAVELSRAIESQLMKHGVQERLTPHQLRLAKQFVADNLHRDTSVSEIAAHVNLSRAHFARAFRGAVGMPPGRFLLEARIEVARELLQANQYSIHEIAQRAGFSSASHFAEMFRRQTGFSPSEYRRNRAAEQLPPRPPWPR